MKELDPKQLIFLDETGVNLALSRLYARAPRGKRASDQKPFQRGKRVTLLGALGLEGIVAAMTLEGSVNGEVFLKYVKEILVPSLSPGKVVVLDNLSVHKVSGIREAIEAVGARLEYLPPYSPDLNPIEECWSKLKAFLRTQAARTLEALQEAVSKATETVTQKDAFGWFVHGGYCIALK